MSTHPDKITRRSTLAALARAGAAFFIPAWNETIEAANAITCVPSTPAVTEGPYWVDEKLFRSDIRTDPSNGVARAGVPLTLTIAVQNLSSSSCAALAGAYVDIWHCDAKGIYSDEPTYNPGGGTGNVTTTGQKFLRGYQITDANGQVQFTTVYPGWYSGRTIHIHVRVRTYSGTSVLGNFVSQVFFDDSINNTVLAQTAYSRSTSRDTTNATDMVYNVANQTRMLAAVTGNVASGYAASITFGVTLTAPAAAAPAITTGGIGNAFSGAAGISPNTWISIYGSNFSVASQVLTGSDIVNNAIPISLGNVSVQVNGKAAFVEYVSPGLINILTPSDSSAGSVGISVTNTAGTSTNITTTMSPVLPGLAVLSNYVRAIRFPDGVIINGTGNAEAGFTTAAAVGPGDVVALFGSGFGPTSPSVDAGLVFTGSYPTTNQVTVTIGGISAEVFWSGLSAAGLDQINVQIPLSLPDGDHTVVAMVAGSSSQLTALLKVAASAALKSQGAIAQFLASLVSDKQPSPRRFHPMTQSNIEDIIKAGGIYGPGRQAGAPREDSHRLGSGDRDFGTEKRTS